MPIQDVLSRPAYKTRGNDLTFRDANIQGNSTYSLIYFSRTLNPTRARESAFFVYSAREKSRHACGFFSLINAPPIPRNIIDGDLFQSYFHTLNALITVF